MDGPQKGSPLFRPGVGGKSGGWRGRGGGKSGLERWEVGVEVEGVEGVEGGEGVEGVEGLEGWETKYLTKNVPKFMRNNQIV